MTVAEVGWKEYSLFEIANGYTEARLPHADRETNWEEATFVNTLFGNTACCEVMKSVTGVRIVPPSTLDFAISHCDD